MLPISNAHATCSIYNQLKSCPQVFSACPADIHNQQLDVGYNIYSLHRLVRARTSERTGRLHTHACSLFHVHAVSHAHDTPNVTSIEKEREGAADAQPGLRGGDIEARQQKSEEGNATPDLPLLHKIFCAAFTNRSQRRVAFLTASVNAWINQTIIFY